VKQVTTTPELEREKAGRSTETEAVILEAARDLLAEGGLEALSMRVVAERVGLSATAIYRYFEGKQDLVRCVVGLGYRRFEEYLQDAAERHPVGSLARLAALGESYVRFAFENQEYFRVLFNIQARRPRAVEELPGRGGYDLLRECVVDAMEAGALRRADPDLVVHYLWTHVHGLVTLALACNLEGCGCAGPTGPPSPVNQFHAVAPFLWEGLRPPLAAPDAPCLPRSEEA
jgi:AcrR family transcriptional regulator